MTYYLIDTNILSKLFKKNPDEALHEKINKLIGLGQSIYISAITYYEIKRGLLSINAHGKLSYFENLCKEYKIIYLESHELFNEASNIYADLYKKGKLISDADILIAATAKFHELTLISDDRDFENIEGLNCIKTSNWLTQPI